ncbi:MAG: hypothetical protein LC792_10040, partial [Actinobacteria bacterium]|nr:hypothetical protein [Actinomycetota bacterium]
VYVAADFSGLYKSTDRGATWDRVLAGRLFEVAVEPFYHTALYALTADQEPGLIRSLDGGRTWETADAGIPSSNCLYGPFPDPLNPGVLYLTDCEGGLFTSSDRGSSWSRLASGVWGPILPDPTKRGRLFAVGGSGILRSTDGGQTFTSVNTGLNGLEVDSLLEDPEIPDRILAGTGYGLFESEDAGRTWNPAGGFPPEVGVTALGLAEGDVVTFAAANGESVYESRDAGRTWSRLPSSPPGYRTYSLALDPSDPSVLYAGTTDGLFKTSDAGSTWAYLTPGLHDRFGLPLLVNSVVLDPSSANIVYATPGYRSAVMRSTDGGETWTDIGSGIHDQETTALAIAPSAPSTLYTSGFRTYVTHDGGGHWREVRCSTGGATAISIDATDPRTVVIGGRNGICARTATTPWADLSEGLLKLPVQSVALDPRTKMVYAGTEGGSVFQRHLP